MPFILLFIIIFQSLALASSEGWSKNNPIDNAVIRYGLKTEPELIKFFSNSNMVYPPKEIALVAFKHERQIELWAKNNNNQNWQYIRNYPLTAYSGHLGPKLKENDGQIPEGIYRLIAYNPHSSMHLSIMLDYPNHFDRGQALKDGRKNLGDNIFLHGKASSAGCLAVGNKAMDQLFLLARRVGLNNIAVVIAPNDLRISKPLIPVLNGPKWLPELYRRIANNLKQFPSPHKNKIFLVKNSAKTSWESKGPNHRKKRNIT